MLAVTCSGTCSFKIRHVYKHRLGNCLMYSRVRHRYKTHVWDYQNQGSQMKIQSRFQSVRFKEWPEMKTIIIKSLPTQHFMDTAAWKTCMRVLWKEKFTVWSSSYTVFEVIINTAVYSISHVIFFQAWERAEFSKSCNLIGSKSGRYFTILPTNLGGIVGSFIHKFVSC